MNFISGIYDLSQDDLRLQFLKEYVLDLRSENSITYSIWSKLFCADLIKKCYESLNDEQQFGEDALCFIRCIFESKRIALDSRAFYYYRIQSQSLSHMECKSLFVKQVKLCGDVIRILEEYMDEGALLYEKFDFLISSERLYLFQSDGAETIKSGFIVLS